MVTYQSSKLGWEVTTVELSVDFLSLGRWSVIFSGKRIITKNTESTPSLKKTLKNKEDVTHKTFWVKSNKNSGHLTFFL